MVAGGFAGADGFSWKSVGFPDALLFLLFAAALSFPAVAILVQSRGTGRGSLQPEAAGARFPQV